jgi:hypothetical protein
MAPKTENLPASVAKQPGNATVANDVPSDFALPVRAIPLRHPAVPPAAMPEAAVNEDSKTLTAEYEIRLSGKVLISTPACNSARSKNCNQLEFRFLVSFGLNRSHYLRALNFVEDVTHTFPRGSSEENLWFPDKHEESHFLAVQRQRFLGNLEKPCLNQ